MSTKNQNSIPRAFGKTGCGMIIALLGAFSLTLLCSPTTSLAASAPCRAVVNETQLTHVNDLLDSGAIQERIWFGERTIHLDVVSRHGDATKLRPVHAKRGNSHLAFDYGCPALLQIEESKYLETCEPNPVKKRITCGKRWFLTSSKERWILLDRPINLHITSSPQRMVRVGLEFKPLFIPGVFVLEPATAHSSTLEFGGSN